jgi:transcriptional regulator with XRE-family HTH domain
MNPRPKNEVGDTSYSERFAGRLTGLREKANRTIEQVADIVGVSPKTVYSWEASRTEPKIDQLPLIAKAVKLKSVRTLFPDT